MKTDIDLCPHFVEMAVKRLKAEKSQSLWQLAKILFQERKKWTAFRKMNVCHKVAFLKTVCEQARNKKPLGVYSR